MMSEAAALMMKPFTDGWFEQSKGLMALAMAAVEVYLAEHDKKQRAMERWNSTSKKKRRALLKAYPEGQEARRVHRRDRQAKRQARRVVRAAGRRAQRQARRRRGGK